MENTYLFSTTTTMKEYNHKKWWICGDVIPQMRINAENVKAALIEFQKKVYNKSEITISDNALKLKNAMYVDTENGTKQVGYVITGSCDFQDEKNYRWSKQFVDLWVNIDVITTAEFKEV